MLKDTTLCGHCHREYADHNYDTKLDLYRCPEQQYIDGYGGFYGGDPRRFFPDVECCSEEEIANYKAACAAFDDAESKGIVPGMLPCESGWQVIAGTAVHIFASQFGIGGYSIPIETYFEPIDE